MRWDKWLRRGHRRRCLRDTCAVEVLESRTLLTAISMTPQEQLLLELINRSRANPTAETDLYGIDLNQGLAAGTISSSPKTPLAPHQILVNVAGAHSDDMLENDYFDHTSLAGESPSDRARAAGYPTGVGENIGWGGSTGAIDQNAHVYARHRSLFLSPGHRRNILRENYQEVGTGVRYGVYTADGTDFNASMVTEVFALASGNPIITGIAYTDNVVDDDFFTIDEQIGSGTITAVNQSSGASFTTDIGPSGGYSLRVPTGTYDVSAALNGQTYVVDDVAVGSANVKVDFETTSMTPTVLRAITVSETGDGTSVMESGRTDTFSVVLVGAPASDVVLTVSSGDLDEVTVSPSSLTFTSANWNVLQVVTVTGQADSVTDGNSTTAVAVAVDAGNSDDDWDSVDAASVSVTNIDASSRTVTLQGLGRVADFIDVRGGGSLEVELRETDGTYLSRAINGRLSLAGYAAGSYEVWVNGNPAAHAFTPNPGFGTAMGSPTIAAIDLDGSGEFQFANDGIILLAFSLGSTGTQLEAFRATGDVRRGVEIQTTIEQLANSLDIDGNGEFQFSTDGMILLSHSLGSAGSQLEAFAGTDAVRDSGAIESRLDGLLAKTSRRLQTPDFVFVESVATWADRPPFRKEVQSKSRNSTSGISTQTVREACVRLRRSIGAGQASFSRSGDESDTANQTAEPNGISLRTHVPRNNLWNIALGEAMRN